MCNIFEDLSNVFDEYECVDEVSTMGSNNASECADIDRTAIKAHLSLKHVPENIVSASASVTSPNTFLGSGYLSIWPITLE